MIVATAGHIDHGKTLLVKALTGVDADRLPEERRRGMTIDLGFAYHTLPGGEVLGFVDVPGHERFIRNMVAGVTGIQFALLVVAADDGVMPQTREHVQILDLIGIGRGAVALTKTDRVEPARVEAVAREVEALLAETTLAGAPVFPVSSITGAGVPALATHLAEAAAATREGAVHGNFRLAVDRVFSVTGAGHVVTGTVFSGRVAVGDQLVLSPRGTRVRVRGLHAQNRAAETGSVGERCALNIAAAGLALDDIHRGDWVLAERIHRPVQKLDARIRVLSSEPAPLRHWTPVHVHLGAADVTGRLAVLGERAIAPGADALCQLVLDQPVGALGGDRLVLRDQSAQRTLAGGRVIDIFPPRRGRARPERIAALEALEEAAPEAALARLLALGPVGLDRFAVVRNLTAAEAEALWAAAPMARVAGEDGEYALAPAHWQRLREAALEAVAAFHRDSPDRPGLSPLQLRLALPERVAPDVFAGLLAALVGEGALAAGGQVLRLPSHVQELSAADAALWEKVRPLLEDGHRQPPVVHALAKTLGLDPRQLERFLRRAAAFGLVVAVAENRFLLPEAVAELAGLAETLAADPRAGGLTAAAYRDRSGIGRNLTIEILEFFDRRGFTRRVGDTRAILKPAAAVFGAQEPP